LSERWLIGIAGIMTNSLPMKREDLTTAVEKDHFAVDGVDEYDPELVKRAWRKVDWHVMPIAVILYLSSYIDRYVGLLTFLPVVIDSA
jgi:hypothetical protein